MDDKDLVPGTNWRAVLDKVIGRVQAAAVCIGPSGLGDTQTQEIEAILSAFDKDKRRVIPVILRSVGRKQKPDLGRFLGRYTCADLRRVDPDPVRQLIRGIRGETDEEKKAVVQRE